MTVVWSEQDIPDLSGRVAVVTGSNSGIGFETARALAGHGAVVILACRSAERAGEASRRIAADQPPGRTEVGLLDLSSLDSVREFAARFLAEHDRLDLLINNAGVMAPPRRELTADGHELQFGVNHLGHFALTGLLLERLLSTTGARCVSVASQAHRGGRMDLEDPDWARRRYRRWGAYGQSKLANLLFMREFDRRLRALDASLPSVAAHPGWTATELQRHMSFGGVLNAIFAMPTPRGARPTLRAAVDPDVDGGSYFGPNGWMEMRGDPVRVGWSSAAGRDEDAAGLWALSERMTGIEFPFPEVAATASA